MPTKFTGRIVFISVVMLVAVACIFWTDAPFAPGKSFLERTAIRPGIDMVGGVSLIYKIKPPQEAGINTGATNLAEQVMEALKKRVDPNGVRNLVWRPIGSDELEIQMPLSSHSETAPKIRQDFVEAQGQLEATNVRQSDVLDAIDLPPGRDRDQKLDDLSQGDPARVKLFKSLADMSDQLKAAKAVAEPDSGKPAATQDQIHQAVKTLDEVGEKFETAKGQIEDDNVNVSDVESLIEGLGTDPTKFQPMLQQMKDRYAGFKARSEALANFQDKYSQYLTIRSTLDDAADLKKLLKGSGVLEFHIKAYDETDPRYKLMYDRMRPGGRGPNPQPGDDTYRWFQVDRPEDFDKPGYPPQTVEWNDKHYILCLVTPEASMTKAQDWALENARPESDEMGLPVCGFTFDTNGGHLFGDLTTRWKPNGSQQFQLATVLDDKVITAPNINGPITGGGGIITGGPGGFSQDDLQYLVNTFNAGSLPAQLEDEPISERRVGSTLGADNLRKGLTACGFGLVVVGVFLVGYYYLAGLVAFIAVLMNLVVILGVLAALNATFTLPSIAAVVLSIGTAVDANVLIFERLREEQHRGLGLKLALRNSYDRAFSAIIDSNMTSIITSIFLYATGSEEVRGFGLTLIIGILASLFTALFVTKTIYGLLIRDVGIKNLGSFPLTFPKWDKFLKPNIDWMGMAWVFYTFSIIAISIGLGLFANYARLGEMLDIEFSSGTSVEFELNHAMTIADVRKLVENQADLPATSVVSVGTDQTVYQVITTSIDEAKVKQAVVGSLGKLLKTQLPSRFVGVDDKTVSDAISDDVAFPIPADLHQWPYGTAPPAARDFTGGVAIRLVNLTPPLSADEIKARIDRDRPTTPGAEKLAGIQVVASGPSDQPTTSAIVLVSHPSITYSVDREGDWRTELANPAWNLVRGAVNHEATLRGVSSFNASVAGDARRSAAFALTLSIIVIMVYIWIRFGNLKYGTATMVALLHDTIFTVAALGFAHWLVNSPIAPILELEPFRINLTVVAGILTIMGYSMIDTIVVFDRIRENRGKFGHLSRAVVNDAINQTLSRTILTCGTTTMTVAFMYFLGGDGIHGFTYVLLVGILVGTYSSVAIAAPLLLVGAGVTKNEKVLPPAPMAPMAR